jgi:hypothetical protein
MRVMKDLLVDNPDDDVTIPNDPYRLQDVLDQMQFFVGAIGASGAKLESISYNDPRTWDLTGAEVGYRDGHWGHFTVNVSPPPKTIEIPVLVQRFLLLDSSSLQRWDQVN